MPSRGWVLGLVAAMVVVVSVVVLVVVTRGADDDEPAATTTTRPATTTTTAPPVLAPLTGLPIDPALADRVALVVKIDNAEGLARPQAGINEADVVIEEKVEGNISRLFAIYQSTDATSVGPVRSARSTDVHLVGPLNRPLFAYSGANDTFLELVRAAPLVDLGYDAATDAYVRRPDRRSPHNLFTSTAALWSRAPEGAGGPAPFAAFSATGTAPVPPGALPATRVGFLLGSGGARVEYRWDAGSRSWRRWQDGTEHVDEAGAQVAPANVIVQYVPYVDSGSVDTGGNPVPEAQTTGAGDALVFLDGVAVPARWTRASDAEVTRFTDEAGQPLALRPGRTWLALLPVGLALDVG